MLKAGISLHNLVAYHPAVPQKYAFSNEKTLSDAAEDGWTNRTVRATDDHRGSSVAFCFHHPNGQKVGTTSAALASYVGSPAFSPVMTSAEFKKGKAVRVSTAVGQKRRAKIWLL